MRIVSNDHGHFYRPRIGFSALAAVPPSKERFKYSEVTMALFVPHIDEPEDNGKPVEIVGENGAIGC